MNLTCGLRVIINDSRICNVFNCIVFPPFFVSFRGTSWAAGSANGEADKREDATDFFPLEWDGAATRDGVGLGEAASYYRWCRAG